MAWEGGEGVKERERERERENERGGDTKRGMTVYMETQLTGSATTFAPFLAASLISRPALVKLVALSAPTASCTRASLKHRTRGRPALSAAIAS